MSALINYDAACTAIYAAESTDEVLNILDQQKMLDAYARISKNTELEKSAFKIRLRAERRLGEMLIEQKKTLGLAPAGRPKKESLGRHEELNTPKKESLGRHEGLNTPTLKDMGISYDLSSRSQKLASIPAKEFEEHLEDHNVRVAANNAITINKLEKSAKSAKPEAEPEYTELDRVTDENSELREAVENLQIQIATATYTGEETGLDDIVTTLRKENKLLKLSVDAITRSRDQYMNENAQLKKQITMMQRKK